MAGMRVTTPAPRASWQALLDADSEALTTQTPQWLDCLTGDGGFEDASRLYQFGSGRSVVVPLARRNRALPALASEESWPFDWGIGGVVTGAEPTSRDEVRAIFDDLARQPVLRTRIRLNPRTGQEWTTAVPHGFTASEHASYILDLDGGFDHVWRHRFRGSGRRAFRKAGRAAIDVEVDRTGRLVPAFYELYEQSIARWAAQQHEPLAIARWRARRANSLSKFVTVAARLGESCAIWMASHSGESVAGIVVLYHGRHAKYWRGAMNKNLATPVRANDLLHGLAIEDASAAGCRFYHMGEARPGSSLAQFKESLGAVAHPSKAYLRERLPITATEAWVLRGVKRALRFQDA
jgi:hypothetical protein